MSSPARACLQGVGLLVLAPGEFVFPILPSILPQLLLFATFYFSVFPFFPEPTGPPQLAGLTGPRGVRRWAGSGADFPAHPRGAARQRSSWGVGSARPGRRAGTTSSDR